MSARRTVSARQAPDPDRWGRLQRQPHAVPPPASGGLAATALELQRAVGNRVVARLLDPVGVESPWSRLGLGEWPGQREDADTDDRRAEAIAAEWKRLEPVHKRFNEPTLAFYTSVRGALLAAFGAAAAGEDVALGRVLAYYGSRMVEVTFMGLRAHVHADMAAALATAEGALTRRFPLVSLGGVSIRFNANNPAVLSDHSYGSAIDINGETSPNVKDLGPGSARAQLIEAITGTDPAEDASGAAASTKERTMDEMLREAQRLSVASERLVDAFETEMSLSDAAYRIACERGDPAGAPDELLALMMAAKDDTSSWTYEPFDAEADGARQQSRLGEHRQKLARFVFPPETADSSRAWDPGVVVSTVNLVARMAGIFTASFAPGGAAAKGRVGPTARSPSDAQLAVHGFQSVPAEVVAALAGSDAANLKWLGTMGGGTKDFMHFELRERPKLY